MNKESNFRIKKLLFYRNLTILMVVFSLAIYFIASSFNYLFSVRYILISFSFIYFCAIVFVKIIELKKSDKNMLEHKIFKLIFHDILYMLAIISGLLSIIFIVFMKEISKSIDIILFPSIFASIIIIYYAFYLVGRKIYLKILLNIFYNTIVHSILFLVLQLLIPIKAPFIWTAVYCLLVNGFYLLKELYIYEYLSGFSIVKKYIQWLIVVLITIIISLYFNERSNSYYEGLVGSEPIMSAKLEFENTMIFNKMYTKDDYYYIIHEGTVKVFSKDEELIHTFTYEGSGNFVLIKGDLYLYTLYSFNAIELYKITKTSFDLVCSSNTKKTGRSYPIIYNNDYYIVYYEANDNYSTVNEIMKIDDNEIYLDLNNLENILYQDKSVLICKKPKSNTYFILFDGLLGYSSIKYSNGYVLDWYDDENAKGYTLIDVDTWINEYIYTPSYIIDEQFINSIQYIDDQLFVRSENDYLVIYKDGRNLLSLRVPGGLFYYLGIFENSLHIIELDMIKGYSSVYIFDIRNLTHELFLVQRKYARLDSEFHAFREYDVHFSVYLALIIIVLILSFKKDSFIDEEYLLNKKFKPLNYFKRKHRN